MAETEGQIVGEFGPVVGALVVVNHSIKIESFGSTVHY